jgi:hypothetical protein
MSSLQQSFAPGKHNPAGERELLIHGIRTAVARSRLVVNSLESIGVALRHNAVTYDQAIAWLKEENLLEHVHFGPEGAR